MEEIQEMLFYIHYSLGLLTLTEEQIEFIFISVE